MDKVFSTASITATTVGSVIAILLGGWDKWLAALIALIVIDYITGVIKASMNKCLSSEIGFKGIGKKVLILLCVGTAVVVQRTTGVPIREIVICFYVANEGISLLENMAEFIPIPEKLKAMLLQLREPKEGKNHDTD